MITTDSHLHSSFSTDSEEAMENIIKAAIQMGLDRICFTEHMDYDFPKGENDTDEHPFLLDTDAYIKTYELMRSKYKNIITVGFGVELGMQPHLASFIMSYVNQYPFDYIIGSEHITNKKDPYYPEFYEGRSEQDAYNEYFEDIVTNLDSLNQTGIKLIDSLGHIDYVVRYGPNKNRDYSYNIYGDIIDEILKRLIDREIALEINTGGYKHNLGQPHPSKEVLLRYKELGGELITVGSDAHKATELCRDFDKAAAFLTDCGYKYYAVFSNRKPIMMNINK